MTKPLGEELKALRALGRVLVAINELDPAERQRLLVWLEARVSADLSATEGMAASSK